MAVIPDHAGDVAGPTLLTFQDKKTSPQESRFTLDGRRDISDIEDKAFEACL